MILIASLTSKVESSKSSMDYYKMRYYFRDSKPEQIDQPKDTVMVMPRGYSNVFEKEFVPGFLKQKENTDSNIMDLLYKSFLKMLPKADKKYHKTFFVGK